MKLFEPFRRWVSWHRRLVAATLAMLGVVMLAQWLDRPTGGESVVVLASDVELGHPLQADDLRKLRVSHGVAPASAYRDIETLLGQRLSVGLPAGSMLVPSLLALAEVVRPGRAVVPISVADPQLRELLRAGTSLSLILPDEQGAAVLCSDALVVANQEAPEEPTTFGAGRTSTLVLVDVAAELAPQVASLGQSGQLVVVLNGG